MFFNDKRSVDEINRINLYELKDTLARNKSGLIESESHVKYEIQKSKMVLDFAPAVYEGESELETASTFVKKNMLHGPTQFDSRIEIRNLNPLIDWQYKIITNAKSVGLIMRRQDIELVDDSIYILNTAMSLEQKFKLCPNEPFKDQPVSGEATGFLISENSFATAAHALEGNIKDYAFVFGYELVNATGAHTTFIHSRDVYFPDSIISIDPTRDIAIARLSRKSERPVLAVFTDASFPTKTEIYMIGFPSGLPQKASVNAGILPNSTQNYFFSSLDAFQGNSGSPVFEKYTGKVIGILVSGTVDFVWNGSCNKSKICSYPYCEGEKIIKLPAELFTENH